MNRFWVYIPLFNTLLQITEFDIESVAITFRVTNVWFITTLVSKDVRTNCTSDKIVEATISLIGGKYNKFGNMHLGK